MAVSGDVTIAQDGSPGNVKLHPYLVTLVRWCVSCLWSTATVLLHRLTITPLQPITGPKPPRLKPKPHARAASTEHLDPEPRVHCRVLHAPSTHGLDVIFVHGLYGSLGNTWRQGDWRQKYTTEPKKVILRDHSNNKTCHCQKTTVNNDNGDKNNDTSNTGNENCETINERNCINRNNDMKDRLNGINDMINRSNDMTIRNKGNDTQIVINDSINTENEFYNITDLTIENIKDKLLNKMIPNKTELITEQFYNNSLLDQVEIIDNYDTQAKFVRDLFEKENNCDSNCETEYNKSRNSDNDKSSNDRNNGNHVTISDNSAYNNDNLNLSKSCNDEYGNGFIYNHNNDNEYTINDKIREYNDINGMFNNFNENSLNLNNGKSYNENTQNYNKIITEKYTLNEKCSFNGTLNEKCSFNGTLNEKCSFNDNNAVKSDNNECKCSGNDKKCEVGCGCVCEECYSSCWPRDWIKADFPDARVISINYTSDPYLWRPLWIKENKRLSLQERAKQMTDQLVALGVGEKPIIWVGHSKGGLFIKQIYCDAYDAYIKLNSENGKNIVKNNINDNGNNGTGNHIINDIYHSNYMTCNGNNDNEQMSNEITESQATERLTRNEVSNDLEEKFGILTDSTYCNASSTAALWRSSAGFMFYSVPHRGSPLADIKTPLTARSVELIEITKDHASLSSLHARWSTARDSRRPVVRSLVETCRTLMSVLWLRIVSVHSADAGAGTLHGVSVDHREICKPSSRRCPLYTELTALIREARAARDCPC